jgi:hypothetical protein
MQNITSLKNIDYQSGDNVKLYFLIGCCFLLVIVFLYYFYIPPATDIGPEQPVSFGTTRIF